MKVYVASHDADIADNLAATLATLGHEIISTWHLEPLRPTLTFSEQDRQAIASLDLQQIEQSEVLVLMAGPEKYSGGKFVEAGFAMGLGKRVIVYGRRENMLLWHESVEQAQSLSELVSLLSRSGPSPAASRSSGLTAMPETSTVSNSATSPT